MVADQVEATITVELGNDLVPVVRQILLQIARRYIPRGRAVTSKDAGVILTETKRFKMTKSFFLVDVVELKGLFF